MKITAITPLAFILALLASSASGDSDCSCKKRPDFKAALKNSALVAVAMVKEKGHNPFRPEHDEVLLKTLRTYKGADELNGDELFVYTPRGKDSCAFDFVKGADYLIFANGSPAFFKVDSCSRTKIVEHAKADLDELEEIKGGNIEEAEQLQELDEHTPGEEGTENGDSGEENSTGETKTSQLIELLRSFVGSGP